jgi:hypothetical protein
VVKSPRNIGELKELIAQRCHNELMENVLVAWQDSITQISKSLKVPHADVLKQFVLHIPNWSVIELTSFLQSHSHPPHKLVQLVEASIKKYACVHAQFMSECGGAPLLEGKWTIYAQTRTVHSENNDIRNFEIAEVDRNCGSLIERNLHYLRSPTANVVERWGLYLENYSRPLAYLSATSLDRVYKITSLEAAIQRQVDPSSILNISRIWGFGSLPANTTSALVAAVGRKLHDQGIEFLVTAVNPIFRFSGHSTFTAGFRPYALAPVAYCYDSNGAYTTRRNGGKCAISDQWPPNILFIKGLSKQARRIVEQIEEVQMIDPMEHHSIDTNDQLHCRDRSLSLQFLTEELDVDVDMEIIRLGFEKAWDEATAYRPSMVQQGDPISKGQCGVTSAYMARLIQKQGREVYYCEGDVTFADGTNSIINHCWLRIPNYESNGKQLKNLIIDLTSDQSGYSESVICEPEEILIKRGITYKEFRCFHPGSIGSGSLKTRLSILRDRINHLHKQSL